MIFYQDQKARIIINPQTTNVLCEFSPQGVLEVHGNRKELIETLLTMGYRTDPSPVVTENIVATSKPHPPIRKKEEVKQENNADG